MRPDIILISGPAEIKFAMSGQFHGQPEKTAKFEIRISRKKDP